MGSLKLLLNRSILFLCAAILILGECSENFISLTDRLPDHIIPLHYDINLELHDAELIFTNGECRIHIQINHPTRNISFHADRSQIQNLHIHLLTSVNDTELAGLAEIGSGYNPIAEKYNKENHINTAFFNNEISSGFYTLHLTFLYVEDRNKGIFFRTSYINIVGDRTWLVATDFQATGARKLFPCWDEPAFKASFNISVKHHKKYTVLSNMPMQMIRETEQPNMTWADFLRTPLLPTYHVSAMIISSHVSSISIGETKIQFRSQLNHRYIMFAISIISTITRHLKSQEMCFKKFIRHPVTHFAIPSFPHNAVSNLGLIYYRETTITYDKEKDSNMRRIEIARLIGRTVAYQCFDNIIPSRWSYMWLNEGIAMLLGVDAIEKAYPEYRMKDLFVVQIQQESLRLDTDFIMKPLISEENSPSDIDPVFSISYYIKAPAIMRMLKEILTDDVFRKGLQMYLSKEVPSFETTSVDAFWVAMQTAYNEIHISNKDEQLNIKQMMDGWTKQQNYPVVKATHSKIYAIILVENMNTKEKNWWIPFTVTQMQDPDFSFSHSSHQLKMLNFSAETDGFYHIITEDKWIIVNLQQIGYYRVNYNAKGWQNIVRYLNSNEYAKIHVLNRAQIIDDAFYFLIKGQLDLSIFLKLISYLSQERDYVAWYPMIKAFEYMSCFFPFFESTYIKYSMMKILDTLIREIGYVTKSDRGNIFHSLKQEVSKWACTLGSSECRKAANFYVKKDLMQENSPSAWLKEWTFCNGLMIADNITWDKVFNIYTEKSDYTILKCLACSEHFSVIRNLTEFIAYNEKIKDNDRIHIFHSIVSRHAKNDTVLHYILANFDIVKPRNISVTVALVDIINHVYSKKQLDMISEFLENVKILISDISNHSLLGEKLYNKMKEFAFHNIQDFCQIIDKTFLMNILLLKCKIERRLSQIAGQIYHFQNLYDSSK